MCDVTVAPAAASAGEFGERIGEDTLRFVRHLRAPVERVWRAIATGDGIAAWLGRPLAIELRAGGRFEVAMSPDDRMNGTVIECEPPRRLAVRWHETSNGRSAPYGTQSGDTSFVTFDLAPAAGGGTTLILEHRCIRGGETMAGFGAGWHAHLEALRAHADDGTTVDRDALYERLKPGYDERIGSAAKT